MRISFVLPGPGSHPVGGFRVVYEYANRLSSRGHQVSIVHLALRRLDATFIEKIFRLARFVERGITGSYHPRRWFDIDPRIDVIWAATPNSRWIPSGDAVIATSWETAEHVAGYPDTVGRRYYLIQDIEDWGAPRQRVMATWQLPLTKVVISRWLLSEVLSLGQEAAYIPNGISSSEFGIDTPIQNRRPAAISMLWHRIPQKHSTLGLEAVLMAKRIRPEIDYHVFGVGPKPAQLPSWASYHRKPTRTELREIYNHSSIFVSPSRQEGWGLPACEAMMCGCAVALTENPGHLEYAVHEYNALLSPIEDAERLSENIIRLIDNQELRCNLAKKAHETMLCLDWEKSVSQLEELLMSPSRAVISPR